MKRILFLLPLLVLPLVLWAGEDVNWERTRMDASRTGVTVPTAADWNESVGVVKGRRYYAPNGRVYKGGSIVRVARTVLDAQPAMTPVKEVIASSAVCMTKGYPESALSNWVADNLMRAVASASGRQVDMSVGNFGGIRVDMPEGDVTVDDIRSMFPFKNDIIYLSMKGSSVRRLLTEMAAEGFQPLGGVRLVAKGGRLLSAEVGGRPLDDNKIYGVATISFLLNGGDGLFLESLSEEKISCPIDVYEAMMAIIAEETAAGRPLYSECDGRVVVD